ncbi:protein-glutamate methylesterase CheB [Verrucomicrobiia bacterium DG1235]|nr:protein-glutamate methylesterase CheB [Verrucomicrobiae bacterium DG1235]
MLVVDDTAVMRKLVSEVVSRDPDMETAGVAANGRIALQMITQVNPDAVTMDMEMPEMGGIETVRAIRRTHPRLPIIMLSALTQKGAESTLDALDAGANDYVAKKATSIGIADSLQYLSEELLPRIKHYFKPSLAALPSAQRSAGAPIVAKKRFASNRSNRIDIVAIGTSTGGPNALARVFEQLRKPLPVPMVIVQHMPPVFTKTLAARLDRCSGMTVHEGEEGQVVQPGHAYMAPGGRHMETRRQGANVVIHLHDGPQENSCRPAADVLFRSVAHCYGAGTLAVVMTGMGKDGYLGCSQICSSGGSAIAQDEASSVVWGMPGTVVQHGLAEQTLSLDLIAPTIARKVDVSRLRN